MYLISVFNTCYLASEANIYLLSFKGDLTQEAEEIMEKPRCAQPDEPERAQTFAPVRFQRSLSGRIKRYSQLGSETWITLPVTVGFQNYWTGGISQQVQEEIAITCCRVSSNKVTPLHVNFHAYNSISQSPDVYDAIIIVQSINIETSEVLPGA